MAGPAFGSDSCIALPSAQIAVMGPEAAVNAVYANRIAAIDDRAERQDYIEARRQEYEADVDLLRLASDLVSTRSCRRCDLRREIAVTGSISHVTKPRFFSDRHHGVPPV